MPHFDGDAESRLSFFPRAIGFLIHPADAESVGAFFWKGAKSLVDVLSHIREYKERAENHLILERSRKLARERIRFMEKALEQLDREISIVELT